MLVVPADQTTEMVARPKLDEAVISVRLPERHESFVETVRSLHYRWNREQRTWNRKIGRLAGEPVDRLVELCHHLLANGFPVEFSDETVRDRAVSGEFSPETRRWVLAGRGEYEGWLRLWWGYGEPDFYRRSRFLSGSQYDRESKCVVVPIDAIAEVEDFAELHGFHIHSEARALIEKQRSRLKNALVADVEIEQRQEPEWKRDRLDQGIVEVPSDLMDVRSVDPFATTTDLMPHQVPAVDRMTAMTVGGLFMDMGTGKTRCAIELACIRQRRISRIVWFCPVSLKTTAVHEILKHTDVSREQIYVFDDDTTSRTIPNATWYIVGLESISGSDRVTLAANALVDRDTMVVVDESSYIKGHASKRTRRVTHMAKRARYRLILTGTPISQGVEDLYAQMMFLDQRILGYSSFYSFAANHLEYHPDYPGLVVRAHNTDWLAAKIQPYVYQVTKDECLDLPPKLHDSRYFRMTQGQRELYEQAKWDILMSVESYDEIETYTLFRLFTALQQITCGFWNRNGAELIECDHYRVDVLDELIGSLPQDEQMIVWSRFRYSVGQIVDRLEQVYGSDSVAQLHGGISDRDREIQRFRDGARFLVATQATGGHGLTLNEARYAVFYANGFKYSDRIQAEDRNHRIGQDKKITYIDLVCSGSIDERIQAALSEKENVARAFRRDLDRVKDAGEDAVMAFVKGL